MKRILLAAMAAGISMTGMAQTDSTKKTGIDTIRIGSIVIYRTHKDGDTKDSSGTLVIDRDSVRRNRNVSTNWFIVDLGFTNYNDRTNYAAAQSMGFTGPGIDKEGMELRNGKSVNVNIWLFMQRINMVKHVVNFKYGLGLELNNYRYDDERVRFTKNPTQIRFDSSLATAKKNKLAVDYITVPAMLNFNFTPKKRHPIALSAGVSAGYLFSARQKIKINDDKMKLHNDFDLERFKLSYIGELSLGRLHLYGSMATRSMWSKGLDQTPYTIGLRLSHW